MRHNDELAAFQTYLHELIANLEVLQEIHDLEALQTHLEVEYEKKLKPQLDDLKGCLRSLGIDVITGAMNIRVVLPPLVASGGAYLNQTHLGPVNPILVGAGALAFSVLPVIREKVKEAKDKIRSTPASYLLRLEEGLEPARLSNWIVQRTRHFFFQM